MTITKKNNNGKMSSDNLTIIRKLLKEIEMTNTSKEVTISFKVKLKEKVK